VSVGPLFGNLLAAQFAEIWERLGKIENFVIAEQGAHDGQFARDVLEAARQRAPDFYGALRYRIIEPFPVLQRQQSRTLQAFADKVEWHDALTAFVGVHFSNELLDSMPVRLISGGVETFVDLEGDNFVLVEHPVSRGATSSEAPHNERVFNQIALDWIDDVATKLQRGYVVAIDYGHSDDEFKSTPRVRARHGILNSPFEQIGYADITMHVNWPRIIERAQASGLRLVGFTDQHHFLAGIISGLGAPSSPKVARQLQTLLHPEMLGRAFQVLGLTKNVDADAPALAGFKFARDLRTCC
jgi:SAM-dependent MidA family methyltransferase